MVQMMVGWMVQMKVCSMVQMMVDWMAQLKVGLDG